MVKGAISNAKHHGISLQHGKPNPGLGDCAIESVIFNINERSCYQYKYPMSINYYRRIFVTDMANRTVNSAWNTLSRNEWLNGWREMLEPGTYERGIFGDLMLPGIACGVKKYMLIFNTKLNSPPIYVVDPRPFSVVPDSDIPVVLAYNLSHYESMHPVTDDDVHSTVNLVKEYLAGIHRFERKDMEYLLTQPVKLRTPIKDTFVSESHGTTNTDHMKMNINTNENKDRTKRHNGEIYKNAPKDLPIHFNNTLITSEDHQTNQSNLWRVKLARLGSKNTNLRSKNKVQTFSQNHKSPQSLFNVQNKGDCNETPVNEKKIISTKDYLKPTKQLSNNNDTSRANDHGHLETGNEMKDGKLEIQHQVNTLPIISCTSKNKIYIIKEFEGKMECPFCFISVKNISLHFNRKEECGSRINIEEFTALFETYKKAVNKIRNKAKKVKQKEANTEEFNQKNREAVKKSKKKKKNIDKTQFDENNLNAVIKSQTKSKANNIEKFKKGHLQAVLKEQDKRKEKDREEFDKSHLQAVKKEQEKRKVEDRQKFNESHLQAVKKEQEKRKEQDREKYNKSNLQAVIKAQEKRKKQDRKQFNTDHLKAVTKRKLQRQRENC